MTKLVTDAMMTRLRDVAETGLQTEVSILNRSIIEGTNGNEDYEAWVTTTTTNAWIFQNDRGPILHLDENNGVISSIGRYRINLPYDTVIEEGDMIGLNGEMFIANEVGNEETYKVFLNVIARKRD
jgi:hypothetical protein